MTGSSVDHDLMRRIERAWAENAARFAAVLEKQDPRWGSQTFPLAGGQAVLCGPGMYVNRALGIGLDGPVGTDELEVLEQRSRQVGVPPAVEIGPLSHPSLEPLLRARGYVDDSEVAVVIRHLKDLPGAPKPPVFRIERADGDRLPDWQETSARGWGHDRPEARRASDAFARAAAIVDGPGLTLLSDVESGEPVATSSLTIRAGVATLGGMSTVPEARGRGAQSASISARLHMAAAAGCDVATSSADPNGGSLRNLRRHGFTEVYRQRTLTRASWV